MKVTKTLAAWLALGMFLGLAVAAHAEQVYWITGPGNNTLIPERYGTASAPLSWFDTTKWFTDAPSYPNAQTPNNAVPTNGQSVAHTGSCCNPEPFVDINNGGLGVNLPASSIRFDAKTNLVDSSAGDVSALPGSYNFAAVDDTLVANVIAFNGAGGAANDVYVPVIANTFTSNRHGANFWAPITVDTILANSGHQDKWSINVSPTGPLTYIDLDENRGADGDSIDGHFDVNADLTVATLDHVWSRLVVGAGATLTVGTYNLSDYSGNAAPNNKPNQIQLNGDMIVDTFMFGGVDQGTGTWGDRDSGADHPVLWITGDGLLTVPTPGGDGDIPEPATMCALGLAVAAIGGYVRRRRKLA